MQKHQKNTDNKNYAYPLIDSEYGHNIILFLLLVLAYALRSSGGFARFASNGDEFFIISHTMRLKSFLVSGEFRSLLEGIFDFFSRPTTYVFNLAGALLDNKSGMYLMYAVYGTISLAILYVIALRIFGRSAALGSVAIGTCTGIHLNYSMKLRSSMPCFILISASIYFFIQSFYGNNKTRDKIVSALLIGAAFTSHNSAGPIPFIYIITECYLFIKGRDKGALKRFFLLLVFMPLPIILWESICFLTIHTGEITSPYFRHYLKRLIFHENLGIPEDISSFYFMYMILRIESIFFMVLLGIGAISTNYFREKGCLQEKAKIFLVMMFLLTAFYTVFSRLACMPRSIFPLYIFLIPLGGLGFSFVYKSFKKRSRNLAYLAVGLIFFILVQNSLKIVRVIEQQQKIPVEMFNFLKKEGVSKFIMGKSFVLSVPYVKKITHVPKVMKISNPEGYEMDVHFSYMPEEILKIAKEHKIKYLQTNYLDYDLNPNSLRHFMFTLHEMGLGRPVRSWGPNEENFPMTFLEEEPFKVQEYERLYASGKIPFSAEEIVYRTMLYDISKLSN